MSPTVMEPTACTARRTASLPIYPSEVIESAPPDDGLSGGAADRIPDHIRSELRQGLIAAVAGAGADDPIVRRLAEQLAANPEALEAVVRDFLQDAGRVEALHETGLMDGAGHNSLDRLATLTAEALGAPFAAISLVDSDRQLLAGYSVADESFERLRPLKLSVSKFAVASGRPLIVDDATAHPLLARHPVVCSGEVAAYAGVLLVSATGHTIGTLCAWDSRAHSWTSGQLQLLQDFAELACAKIFT